jgi:hypothetical protein
VAELGRKRPADGVDRQRAVDRLGQLPGQVGPGRLERRCACLDPAGDFDR